MQVYAQRTIGSDGYIGGLKDRTEILLAKATTNGLFRSSEYQKILTRVDYCGSCYLQSG
jgi:hypothetical protein